MSPRPIAALLCAAAACACSMPSGESERQEAAKQEAAEQVKAGAEGKAEEGRLSIRAPGIDIAINVPDAMRSRARAGTDSDVLPPGAQVSGLHVQGNGSDAAARDSVELRFVSAEAPEQVAAWYRDPARREDFTISSARREDREIVLGGASQDGGPMTVRLSPGTGAGTDGRLILVDRD
ncbi:MAG TPA: hypothetical protein VD887_04670 [Allosphingosinicella sp.]|nr:hypothetical protein [Allosphingosinicella sp.]